MLRFIIKRIGFMILTLFCIITLTFFMMNLLPGDPLSTQVKKLPPAVQQNIRRKWNLDKPVPQRYGIFLKNLVHGDLGESYQTPGLTVKSVINSKFPNSFRLGIQALVFGVTIGVIFGILAAFNKNTWVDYLVMVIAIIGVSVPAFVVGPLLQRTFGGHGLPVVGWPSKHIWTSGFKYTVLPGFTMSLGIIAQYARYSKASVLDVTNQDYILTAKAKGVTKNKIISKHILRNALLPLCTLLGPEIAATFAGAFITEKIFGIPGIGAAMINAISRRDFPMIMGMTIFISFLYVVSLLLVDISYAFVDPRIKVTGQKD